MKYFLTFLFSLICSVSLAAYPYDAVCEIDVEKPRSRRTIGGSGTIIAVSETLALVLSCKHVIRAPGRRVKAYWPNAIIVHHKNGLTIRSQGFTSYGISIDVGDNQDIAAFITQRPPDIRPVRVRLPHVDNGPFTNVGFPSGRGGLEWQQGKFGSLNHSEFRYDVARPAPGMSGGATFDRFGNLVGVIVRYGKSGGVSTSGREMLEFVEKFRKKSGWQVGR